MPITQPTDRLADECHGYDLDGNPVEPIVTRFLSWRWTAYRVGSACHGFGMAKQEAINDFLAQEAETT